MICILNKSICAQKYIKNQQVWLLAKTRPWPWKPRGRFWRLKCLFTRLLAQEFFSARSWSHGGISHPFFLEIFETHLFLSGDSSSDFMLVFSRQQNGKETQLTFFSMRNECPANMMREEVDETLRCHISIVITHRPYRKGKDSHARIDVIYAAHHPYFHVLTY